MAVRGTRHTPARTAAIPASANPLASAVNGRSAASPGSVPVLALIACSISRTLAPNAAPSAAPMKSDGAYIPPTRPLPRETDVASTLTRASSRRTSAGIGAGRSRMALTFSRPVGAHTPGVSGTPCVRSASASTPTASPPIAGFTKRSSPASLRTFSNASREKAIPRRRSTEAPPHTAPSPAKSGSCKSPSPIVYTGITNAGSSPSSAALIPAAVMEARRTAATVRLGERSVAAFGRSTPVSMAKKMLASGALNPAATPAADPAAKRGASETLSALRGSPFAAALRWSATSPCFCGSLLVMKVDTVCPSSTLGPSGPSDPPDPSVTAAAAVLASGRGESGPSSGLRSNPPMPSLNRPTNKPPSAGTRRSCIALCSIGSPCSVSLAPHPVKEKERILITPSLKPTTATPVVTPTASAARRTDTSLNGSKLGRHISPFGPCRSPGGGANGGTCSVAGPASSEPARAATIARLGLCRERRASGTDAASDARPGEPRARTGPRGARAALTTRDVVPPRGAHAPAPTCASRARAAIAAGANVANFFNYVWKGISAEVSGRGHR
mmetsp:Transcript_7945/g.26392  ORF Transcript_7945/g.26392 Transcript_7945/m.26392 type:complete len:558 (+) Transcript_7945:344-2017(+)